jgi:hypothetical protein
VARRPAAGPCGPVVAPVEREEAEAMTKSARRTCRLIGAACLLAALPAAAQEPPPTPGAERSPKTSALEAGAKLLQGQAPPGRLSLHLVGFHPLKHEPAHQMEAHHFCHQLDDELAQCALFDGDGEEARLNGVEYIISERLFETLPADEKKYWHPHNYEILSGQLVAPGIPGPVEHEAMEDKINSYGKTWHVWRTGAPGEPGDALPLGDPHLAWSFNRDGEAKPGLVEARDRKLGVDSAEKRKARQELVAKAKPQCGVDVLAGKLPGAAAETIPGVAARSEGCPAEQ